MTSYNSASQDSTGEQNGQQDQSLVDPLVNALAVSTVPGKQPEPILSMHVSQLLHCSSVLKLNPIQEEQLIKFLMC